MVGLVKPSQLLRAMGVLIEEVAHAGYDRRSGDEQPITREQWDELDVRWKAIVMMNKPRETK